MKKEKITIIKSNLGFKELPKNIQNNFIKNCADAILESFDEGTHTKITALYDARIYFADWNKDKKYILFQSNFHGIQAENQDDYYNN